MNKTPLRLLSVALVGGVCLAVTFSVAGPKRKAHRWSDQKFEVVDDAVVRPKLKRGADKRLRFEQRVKLKIDGEADAKEVSLKAEHKAPADGGQLTLTVTETDSNQASSYRYDPGTNAIALESGGSTVIIAKNPAGGYLVDGKPAATGKAALALIKATPAYKNTPRRNHLAAYAGAQEPVPEVRNSVDCNPNSNGAGKDATAPAVCTLFEDLCECVACDASGAGSACRKCR